MTDPTGLCFLSYRRTRANEAALLVEALRDHGIPTWQDISDLPTTPTEAELRRVLDDPSVASAILLATPEVEHSPMIREVEAPAILARHLRCDGFFAVPVAAGGLNYADMPRVLGEQLGLAHLPGWNIHRVDVDPIDVNTAAAIATIVLHQRLKTIHSRLDSGEPLSIKLGTRAPLPKTPGPALSFDLTHRFKARLATPRNWQDHVLPALRAAVHEIQSCAPNRNIELSGLVAIPLAVALGTAFLSLSGIRTTWIQDQHSFGRESDAWGLHLVRETSDFQVATHARTVGATDIAVLVSVAADVMADFNATASALPPLRAVVSVARPTPTDGGRNVLSAGAALDVAQLTVDALRAARAAYQVTGTVHLFLAVPVGLAMMIGQLLNTFAAVQTYEHVPGAGIPYQPAALLTPSI